MMQRQWLTTFHQQTYVESFPEQQLLWENLPPPRPCHPILHTILLFSMVLYGIEYPSG